MRARLDEVRWISSATKVESGKGLSNESSTHSSRRLAWRSTESPMRRLHRDPKRLTDLRPGQVVLVPGVAHEFGAKVTRCFLDAGHEKRLSKRSLDATAATRNQCSQRLTRDAPLLSG